MKQRFIILTLLLLPTILFGQKKYKFEYKDRLINQPSSYTTEIDSSNLAINKNNLTFQILDYEKEPLPFAEIIIDIFGKKDTLFLLNESGFISTTLPSGTFSITINGMNYTSSLVIDSFELKGNTKATIKTSLSKSNDSQITLIRSVRKLEKIEIEKIIYDLSNNREDNELIKNKTCIISFEI